MQRRIRLPAAPGKAWQARSPTASGTQCPPSRRTRFRRPGDTACRVLRHHRCHARECAGGRPSRGPSPLRPRPGPGARSREGQTLRRIRRSHAPADPGCRTSAMCRKAMSGASCTASSVSGRLPSMLSATACIPARCRSTARRPRRRHRRARYAGAGRRSGRWSGRLSKAKRSGVNTLFRPAGDGAGPGSAAACVSAVRSPMRHQVGFPPPPGLRPSSARWPSTACVAACTAAWRICSDKTVPVVARASSMPPMRVARAARPASPGAIHAAISWMPSA